MKGVLLLIGLGILLPILFYAGNRGMKKMLLYPDAHKEMFDQLLKEEFINRIPKSRSFVVREFPTLASLHRLTPSIRCNLGVPSIKTQDPQEALNCSLPYAQAYVDTINNIPTLRPYLIDFPMPLPMWAFFITFAENEKTHLPLYSPYICNLSFHGHKLEIMRFYETVTYPNGRTVHNGTDNIYDASKGIPDEITRMAIPRFDNKDKKIPQLIPRAKKYCYFNDCMKPWYNFCSDFAQRNDFVFIAFDGVYDMDRDYNQKIFTEAAYASQTKKLSLDEAKELSVKLRDEHASFCLSKFDFSYYVNDLRKRGEEEKTNPINLQKYLSFRLSFWDEYIDRVMAPAIAEVRVYGTRARYYVADELQRLQCVCEEEFPPFEREIPVEDVVMSWEPSTTGPSS